MCVLLLYLPLLPCVSQRPLINIATSLRYHPIEHVSLQISLLLFDNNLGFQGIILELVTLQHQEPIQWYLTLGHSGNVQLALDVLKSRFKICYHFLQCRV